MMKRDHLYYMGAGLGLVLGLAPMVSDRVLFIYGHPFTVLLCLPGVALTAWSVVAGAQFDRNRTASRMNHPTNRKGN